jgi:hypothetical protein
MIAYFIEGFRSDALIASFLPILVLTIVYIPIARLIGRTVLVQRGGESTKTVVQT